MTTGARTWSGAIGVGTALVCSVLLLSWATDGFAVLTTDAARARRVQRAPVTVPTVSVRGSDGAVHDVLRDLPRDLPRDVPPDVRRDALTDSVRAERSSMSSTPGLLRPRAVIVDFVYTRCITVCGALGGVYQVLQREIEQRGLQDKVRLLTVSFDLEHDDPRSLAMYARVHRAHAGIWSLVTPVTADARDQLLRTFGVQVVPDGVGGWVHNAALHVVDPGGKLVRIVDITDGETALAVALTAWNAAP